MSFHNEDDWPVEASKVKRVNVYDDGGCEVTQESGWTFFISGEEIKAANSAPSVGDECIVLGGLGFSIRGIFIGGVEYRYKTRAQADRERQEWLAEYEAKKEADFQKNIDKWLETKNSLDEPFQSRIQRFEDGGFKEFWKDSGAYELFAVEQANKLYRIVMEKYDPITWLDEFYNADWNTQKEMFPELDEGHSGNTFGAMVGLARAVVEGKQI